MADAPWRCSQCGTVNEPVANACRTCGRWPSLFELEGSTIESEAPVADDDLYAARTVEVEELDPGLFEVDADQDPALEFEEFEETEAPAPADDYERPKPIWQRLASLLVPVGVVLYFVISALADR